MAKGRTRLHWQRGRAYGDFRDFKECGGKMECIKAPGETRGTEDAKVAEAIIAERLQYYIGKSKLDHRVGTFTTYLNERYIPKREGKIAAAHADAHGIDVSEVDAEDDHYWATSLKRLAFAAEYFGDSELQFITALDVESWLEWLCDTGKVKSQQRGRPTDGTLANYIRTLSAFFEYAKAHNAVPNSFNNPVRMLRDKPQSGKREKAAYDHGNAAVLLEGARLMPIDFDLALSVQRFPTVRKILYPLVAILLYAGLRKSEALGLLVKDIDLENDEIKIVKNVFRRIKNKPSVRNVPIPSELKSILEAWLLERDGQPDELLFPNENGVMFITIEKAFDALAKFIDWKPQYDFEPTRIRPHEMRHTYASIRMQCVEASVRTFDGLAVPIKDDRVMREMGHGSMEMIRSVYGHNLHTVIRSEEVTYDLSLPQFADAVKRAKFLKIRKVA